MFSMFGLLTPSPPKEAPLDHIILNLQPDEVLRVLPQGRKMKDFICCVPKGINVIALRTWSKAPSTQRGRIDSSNGYARLS